MPYIITYCIIINFTIKVMLLRTILRDDQWEHIKDLLLGKSNDCGVTASNNLLFVEAVLWIARTGSPWRDLPDSFGQWL